MIEIAKTLVQDYPNVMFQNSTFEDGAKNFTNHSIDLIFAAASFHWVDNATKWKLTHQLLKPNGFLAVIGGGNISDERGDHFHYAAGEIIKKYVDEKVYDSLVANPTKLSDLAPTEEYDKELYELDYFGVYPQKHVMSTERFIQFLGGASFVIALDLENREKMFEELKVLVDEKFEGTVERNVGNLLVIYKAK